MQYPREEIVSALLTLVQGAAEFKTFGRRLVFPEDVPEQPAIFVRYLADLYPERPTRMLPRIVMECEVWIYCQTPSPGDPNSAPDRTLNPLIDAVELALAPPPGHETQTLGGMVVHCWIEGKIEKNPGDLDDTLGQAMAIIPVRILAP